jgi:hypothetical protein
MIDGSNRATELVPASIIGLFAFQLVISVIPRSVFRLPLVTSIVITRIARSVARLLFESISYLHLGHSRGGRGVQGQAF